MKITFSGRQIQISVQTAEPGGSAVRQIVDDPNTEVYFGDAHARVIFLELELAIVMDPEPGEWTNAAWSRERACRAVAERLTPAELITLIQYAKQVGVVDGTLRAQQAMRESLGIKGKRYED